MLGTRPIDIMFHIIIIIIIPIMDGMEQVTGMDPVYILESIYRK